MHWMVAAIMVLAELLIASIAYAQPDQHKKVLVLYSTRRDAQFSVVGESELPRILDEGLSRNLDYYAEFIDVTRFPDRTYRQGFRDFLQVKYQGVRFDLVLALQSAAVEFVNGLDIPLVRETPLVFLTNTSRTTRRPTPLVCCTSAISCRHSTWFASYSRTFETSSSLPVRPLLMKISKTKSADRCHPPTPA
jgi:hypothetical protein